MKITTKRRFALLAGLFLVASIVLATGVQTAQASVASTGGSAGGTGVATTPVPLHGPPAGVLRAHDQGLSAPAGTAPAPAGTQGSSRTAWIAGGSAAVALIVVVGAWALLRRRRQPSGHPSAAYCAQHPEDPQCAMA
jgi:hypothetical protein